MVSDLRCRRRAGRGSRMSWQRGDLESVGRAPSPRRAAACRGRRGACRCRSRSRPRHRREGASRGAFYAADPRTQPEPLGPSRCRGSRGDVANVDADERAPVVAVTDSPGSPRPQPMSTSTSRPTASAAATTGRFTPRRELYGVSSAGTRPRTPRPRSCLHRGTRAVELLCGHFSTQSRSDIVLSLHRQRH